MVLSLSHAPSQTVDPLLLPVGCHGINAIRQGVELLATLRICDMCV